MSMDGPTAPILTEMKSNAKSRYQLDMGAQVTPEGVQFRLWSPKSVRVEVVLNEGQSTQTLEPEANGWWSGIMHTASDGMTYQYRLDGRQLCPDPCSRFQPNGPHGPSQIVDPSSYRWHDENWMGIHMHGQVIYEVHIGTFTHEGTFDAAITQLDELRTLGITVIEVMPVAEFPGHWNWGYDGVDLYAPAHVYGDPHALKRFVDEAHRRGLSVILDVVYNHLGPDGNFLPYFSENYFTDRYPNEWGKALNFDGPDSAAGRHFCIQNACYWINEFHIDGLRLDAVHAIHDSSPIHVIAALSRAARDAAGERSIILIAECETQWIHCIQPIEEGGWGLDGIWSEDFHHAVHVAATGRSEGYSTDYRGTPQELISCVKRAFLYQGQRYQWQRKPRGTVVATEPAEGFVFFIQNHDQIANQLWGDRLHSKTSPGLYRALTALLLLSPQTPMLFMGQEFCASASFSFFADFAPGDLAKKVHKGRKEFLAQFPSYASGGAQANIADPCSSDAYNGSKLDLSERWKHAGCYALYRDLLRFRREDPILAKQDRAAIDGAVIGQTAFVLRYAGQKDGDRLLLINLGPDLLYRPAPEPLLAPSPGGAWSFVWSSDAPNYGGPGIIEPLTEQGWSLPGESAVLYAMIEKEN